MSSEAWINSPLPLRFLERPGKRRDENVLQDLSLQVLRPRAVMEHLLELKERCALPLQRVGLSDDVLQEVFEELELRDEPAGMGTKNLRIPRKPL